MVNTSYGRSQCFVASPDTPNDRKGVLWAPAQVRVSPTLDQAFTAAASLAPGSSNDYVSVKGCSGIEYSYKVMKDGHQDLIVTTTHVAGCKHMLVEFLKVWCNFHINDAMFEEALHMAEFDEDEHERAQERLRELPCYFDWKFLLDITNGGLDESSTDADRVALYDTMELADFLQLDNLLLVGSKFIYESIKRKNVTEVRQILGIIADFPDPNEEREIRKKNEAVLGKLKRQ